MTIRENIKFKNQRVLLLGSTGSIGGAIAEVLRKRKHDVTCLVRSDRSEEIIMAARFDTIRGDIRSPEKWIGRIMDFDAVIQTAITWSDDMNEVDQRLMKILFDTLSTSKSKKTVIYTEGCWRYGNTGDHVATEDSPVNQSFDFGWSIGESRYLHYHENVRAMVIHPAMVYERDGGVLERMIIDIHQLGYIRVVGDERTRWTLVHRDDLALLYTLALESGEQGTSYNGAGIITMKVSQIAQTIAKRHGISQQLKFLRIDEAVSQFGRVAKGYGLDQQMSSNKAIQELGWNPKHTDILTELA